VSLAPIRPIAFVAVLALLSGCDSTGTSDYSLYYQAVRQSVAASFGGSSHITREQAAAVPYASIGYRLNDGPEQLLVLATDSGEEQLWTSGAHVVIVTRGGRVVRTVGLPQDVAGMTPERGQQLFEPAAAMKGSLTNIRLEDIPSIPAYGAAIKCVAQPQGIETIVLLGHGVTTRKIDETCRSDALGWSFTDSYWVDPDSTLVWRSIQHIDPKGEKLEIETLRPPD
jgi:Group 4 capsule polysaccharide lipoprotein gfcB, YjbF